VHAIRMRNLHVNLGGALPCPLTIFASTRVPKGTQDSTVSIYPRVPCTVTVMTQKLDTLPFYCALRTSPLAPTHTHAVNAIDLLNDDSEVQHGSCHSKL
jgi:hypothetical protein